MPNYYADPSRPDNSGNGTTPATAKKYLGTILGFITRGLDQNFWLRAGMYHDVGTVALPSIQGAHMRIRRYGDGGNPCIDARNWIEQGSNRFTLVGPATKGGYVWSIQIGTTSTAYRVWSKSTNKGILLHERTIGEALRHVPNEGTYGMGDNLTKIANTLSNEDTWYGAGSSLGYRIYIWTRDLVDPADYWEGLSVAQSGTGTTGADYAFNVTRTQDLIVSGIDSFGTRAQNVLIRATDTDTVPCTGIGFEDCNMLGSSFGVAVQQTTTATGIANNLTAISDVWFKRCTVNTNSSAREQEPDYLRYGRLAGSTDLFLFTGRIDNVRAEDCVSINGNHSGMTLGALDANSSLPRRTGFRNHLVKADDWNTYARGLSTFLCDPSCFFESCTLDGMNVRAQYSGEPLITSMNSINNRASIRDPNTDGHIAVESFIMDRGTANIGNEKYVYIKPVNVRMVNCTFGPTPGTPIVMNSYLTTAGSGLPAATIDPKALKLENCLLIDTDPSRANKPIMLTYEEGGLVVGEPALENLAVWKGEGVPTATVQFRSYTGPIEGMPGVVSPILADPKVSKDLRPLSGSPLIGAGKPAAKRVCNDGRRFKPTPTIGAFEHFPLQQRGVRK